MASTTPERARFRFEIDPDISRAQGPPPAFYGDAAWFEEQRRSVFESAWLGIGEAASLATAGAVRPLTLLEGVLDEPMLLARGADGRLRCLSNVCTHRGKLVVEAPGCLEQLYCRYHGRRFGLDGRCRAMPEFHGVAGFPSATDDLTEHSSGALGPLAFASVAPREPFADWIAPVLDRVGFLPLEEFRLDPASQRDYIFDAAWALYCDNYLEGFHIPFIHAALIEKLDFGSYRTETFGTSSLQVGIAADGEPVFDLPRAHRDFGQRVGAYYFWLYPSTMLNFYPWGLSVNDVKPLGPARTKVSFASYVWKPDLRGQGAGSGLHRVEMEDEDAVCSVQIGVRSRFARRARYSTTQEIGVHHFHRLLAEAMGR